MRPRNSDAAGSADAGSSDNDETAAADPQRPQTSATRGATAAAADEAAAAADDSDKKKPQVNLMLALPEAGAETDAPSETTALAGGGVHLLSVAQPRPGQLQTAAAASSAALVLTLERQDAAGAWQMVALDQGLAPVVAVPADAGPAPWRAEVWPVDGGPGTIRFAARALDAATVPPGPALLAAVEGLPVKLSVAHIGLTEPGVVALQPVPEGLLAGGWPGHALRPVQGGKVIPQGSDVWLLGHGAPVSLAAEPLQPAADSPIALALPEGARAVLPADRPEGGSLRAWLAESGLGQPGIDAGHGMGAATGSALALGGAAAVIRNAGSDEALPLRVTRLGLTLLQGQTPQQPVAAMLDARTALPVTLPEGDKALQFDLAPGTAAIANWETGNAVTAWAGADAISRSVQGAWTKGPAGQYRRGAGAGRPVLGAVATGGSAAPGAGGETLLRRRRLVERHPEPGAPAPQAGARLVIAGRAEASVIFAGGRIRRGRSIPLDGPGRAVITHATGPLAVWIEAEGVSPWPQAEARPVSLPARLVLAGPAMALRLSTDTPVLLHASTTAPVLLALAQGDRPAKPVLFPAGAEFHRALAAGPAELRLYAPQDGPLSGTLALSAQPVTPVTEGLGPTVTVAPGGSAVFGFQLAKAGTIGVGVRAEPDDASVRLLDAAGHVLGQGVAQLRSLTAGHYLLEASVPARGVTTLLRPAVIGITPHNAGPPPDVARHYLELVGLAPQGDAP